MLCALGVGSCMLYVGYWLLVDGSVLLVIGCRQLLYGWVGWHRLVLVPSARVVVRPSLLEE